MWVLETKLWSFARTVQSPKCWATSPAPNAGFSFRKSKHYKKKTVNTSAIKEFWQTKKKIKHLRRKLAQSKYTKAEKKKANKYPTKHLNIISIQKSRDDVFQKSDGKCFKWVPRSGKRHHRETVVHCCASLQDIFLGTCLSGKKNCSLNHRKCQLQREQCSSVNTVHFPYHQAWACPLCSLGMSLSHPSPPWEIPACHSIPSSGVSSSRTCPSIHWSPNTSHSTSLLCFLKPVSLSTCNIMNAGFSPAIFSKSFRYLSVSSLGTEDHGYSTQLLGRLQNATFQILAAFILSPDFPC